MLMTHQVTTNINNYSKLNKLRYLHPYGTNTNPTHTTVNFLRQYRQVPGYLLPDPLAMAITLNPMLVHHSDQHYVTVELQGAHTRGQTVIDFMGTLGREPNVQVVLDLDTDAVYQMYEHMLA